MSGQTIERLPDAELEVMQAIWDCEPPVSRADIEPLLQRRHPMATTTLLTLLGRPKAGQEQGVYAGLFARAVCGLAGQPLSEQAVPGGCAAVCHGAVRGRAEP